MANIKGIELASDIYDLEDTQGREATQTAQNTASNASNKADSNKTAIEAIKAVIPSTATGSNKLVAENELSGLCKIVSTTYTMTAGTEVANSSETHPDTYWSADISLPPPESNAFLINIIYQRGSWYPNLSPVIRGSRNFNIISKTSYTTQENINYICIWAVPNS